MALSTSPVFVLCVFLALIMFLSNLILTDAQDYFSLVCGNTLIVNKYVWNLVTSCFYEKYVLKIIADLVILNVITKNMKIIGGNDQFGLYFVLCILACTIGTSVYCFIRFFGTGMEEMLMTPIYGFGGVVMTLLMYARLQFKGEALIETFPLVTYQNLPLIIVIIQSAFWLIGLRSFALDVPFTVIALLFSWSYLRFFYRFQDSLPPGDKSQEFSFVAMFPDVLQPVVSPLTTGFYNIFAMIGIFPELEQAEKRLPHHLRYHDKTADALYQSDAQDAVAKRLRSKGMKLLDARMAELSQEGDSWGDSALEKDPEKTADPVNYKV